MTDIRIRAEVRGIVQGVGFRPFVYGLAQRYGLSGFVRNTSFGALMEIEGEDGNISSFFEALTDETPRLARVTRIDKTDLAARGQHDFLIEHSSAVDSKTALISPDVAVCDDCLKEMFDPADRRYRYPFINCTNCGPRYTIIMDLPYDRDKTSMGVFEMCPLCSAEYHDPGDRRFHAQPNACPVCGPGVWLLDADGRERMVPDPIAATAHMLRQGHIAAVKGLGGFHLAVDACNEAAVARLRERKRREEKPLAVMAPDLASVRAFARVTGPDREVLTSMARPIVLLEKQTPFPLAAGVAPDNRYIGTMLPYTPLHHLLLEGFSALVMTSGNISEEPIAIDNQEALQRLSGLADCFLVHNRDIYLRSDDSVVRAGSRGPIHIRRSRGFVPVPVFLHHDRPPVLAVGGEQKNTICLIKEDRAFVSQHIGDLENIQTLEFFEMTIDHLQRVLDIKPEMAACDRHPDYLSTKWALDRSGLPVAPVQHHHAHLVSALAENHLDGPVVGIICDGTGYGDDGEIWGGEILVGDEHGYERRGQLDYVVLPGGAAAIREPWRMAAAYLHQAYGREAAGLDIDLLERQDSSRTALLWQVIEKRIGSPLTSSLGRLFDAVAALAGLKDHAGFEGQPAMMLEMCCPEGDFSPYIMDVEQRGHIRHMMPQAMIREVVQDLKQGRSAPEISGRFHAGIVRTLAETAVRISRDGGLRTVVLSGGCFQNQVLTRGLTCALESAGMSVFTQTQVPANDGGLSLGQAVAAGGMESE